ncbi:MAG TPA: nuclear transport factor 2 family protein [Candidatus Nanopelagicaceae bacterium]|nr:nuclear transport factor 2 family protein [Candidatus Nanopelagicaceae bacterium]
MTEMRDRAGEPEDLARLFVERWRAGDAEGLTTLYEPDAVLAYPPGQVTVGHQALLAVFQSMVAMAPPPSGAEAAMPTVRNGDLALTSTRPADNTGGRVQVARRLPDGTWLRVIDRPELPR